MSFRETGNVWGGNFAPLVDKLIGTAFYTVREVADNLNLINQISQNLTLLQTVESNIAVLQEINSNIALLQTVESNLTLLQTLNSQLTVEVEPNIQQFEGSDNGVQTNDAALARAVAGLPAGSEIWFPRRTAGVYNFAADPVPGGLIFDIDPNVVIQSFLHPPSSIYLSYDANFLSEAWSTTGPNPYFAAKDWHDSGSLKKTYLSSSLVDRSTNVALNVANSTSPPQVSHISFSFGSDTITGGILPPVSSANTVEWNLTVANLICATLYAPQVGDRLGAFFPIVSNLYDGCIVIMGSTGSQVIYFTSAGVIELLSKPVGVASTLTNLAVGFPSYETYLAPYGIIEITVISGNQFVITIDGMPIISVTPIASLGIITGIGFGCFATGSTPVTVPIQGWSVRSGIEYGSSQLGEIFITGDSLSDPSLYGQWWGWMKQWLDGSLGIRITGFQNIAVVGQTSSQQLASLLATTLNPNVIAAVIYIGVNDIQIGYPVGAPGTANTFIDNVYQMINWFTTRGIPVIVIEPPLYFPQSFTIGGTLGAPTGVSYSTGSPYRMLLRLLCAELGARFVSTIDADGMILAAQYWGTSDTWTRDNIHRTAMANRVLGFQAARAVAGMLAPQPNPLPALGGFSVYGGPIKGPVQFQQPVTFANDVQFPSYTVATLPATGIKGQPVYCSNARRLVINITTGLCSLEAVNAGNGANVEWHGSAWCLYGTDVVAQA
jgi:lysophospholipase L1-like esterase